MAPPVPRTQPPKKDERPTPWRVEGEREPEGGGGDRRRMTGPPFGRRWLYLILGLLAFNVLFAQLFTPRTSRVEVPYTFFLQQIEADNVREVNARGEEIKGEFKKAVSPEKDVEADTDFETVRPAFASEDDVFQQLRDKNVTVDAESPNEGPGTLATLLIYFGPTLLLVAFFVWIARRAAGAGAGGLTGLGRSRARRYEPSSQRVTFDDVEGIDEAEDELVEIVDFLKQPDRYRRLGAAIPKGVLLSGPPGTGKTLLARAVAGEADVPFFSLSASEFIEMVVGVGASRVRDLFEQAKKAAPAIIFIDELDAIGRARGSSSFGGSDEREQTLNQILTEMDGFESGEAVIVLGATNRPEILDQALLRPGRFDRQVFVPPPDMNGRRQILEVHTRGKPLAQDVDLERVARHAAGLTGADLANLCNEAAILAGRNQREFVTQSDFDNAFERVVAGLQSRKVITDHEKQVVAWHEAGHALVSELLPTVDKVQKVSIVPRGKALGYTLNLPQEDRYLKSRQELIDYMKVLLAGRVSEQITFGRITTGASDDLKRVTDIARAMVFEYGMGTSIRAHQVPGDDYGVSEKLRQTRDEEVHAIAEEAYRGAYQLLVDHRDLLDQIAERLLTNEVIERDEIRAILSSQQMPRREDVPQRVREAAERAAGVAAERAAGAAAEALASEPPDPPA